MTRHNLYLVLTAGGLPVALVLAVNGDLGRPWPRPEMWVVLGWALAAVHALRAALWAREARGWKGLENRTYRQLVDLAASVRDAPAAARVYADVVLHVNRLKERLDGQA